MTKDDFVNEMVKKYDAYDVKKKLRQIREALLKLPIWQIFLIAFITLFVTVILVSSFSLMNWMDPTAIAEFGVKVFMRAVEKVTGLSLEDLKKKAKGISGMIGAVANVAKNLKGALPDRALPDGALPIATGSPAAPPTDVAGAASASIATTPTEQKGGLPLFPGLPANLPNIPKLPAMPKLEGFTGVAQGSPLRTAAQALKDKIFSQGDEEVLPKKTLKRSEMSDDDHKMYTMKTWHLVSFCKDAIAIALIVAFLNYVTV